MGSFRAVGGLAVGRWLGSVSFNGDNSIEWEGSPRGGQSEVAVADL